jgi:hypothetical protein
VRGNHVSGEHSSATTSNTTSFDDEIPDDGFVLDICSLYINMVDDTNTNVNALVAPYEILFHLFRFLMQSLMLVFGTYMICISSLDAIC